MWVPFQKCTLSQEDRPILQSVIMGNVRSFPNKMDELTALTQHQRDYCECSIMVLMETWITELTPDTDVNLDGFQQRWADMTAESGKKKGGGLAVFVNDRWFNSGHIAVKEEVCSKDINIFAVSMRPYYLPREFTQCSPRISPPLLTLKQLVMFFILSQAHCRHITHRPTALSLGTSIMPPCPPPCPHPHQRQ